MSDAKISGLPSSSGVTSASDYIPIVHNGTTEKITPDELILGIGLATDAELALKADTTTVNAQLSLKTNIADLAATTGATLVGTIQSSIGAVARTVNAKLKETVSVLDFGAVNDGVTDNTAAIQAAVDSLGSGGGAIYFPKGVYKISGTITITQYIKLEGESRFSTLIKQSTNDITCFQITGNFNEINNLSFIYSSTPIANAKVINCLGSYNIFQNFIIRSAFDGIYFLNGVANKVTNFELLDYYNTGITIESLNDIFIDSFIINAGRNTGGVLRGALGGIRLINKAEAVIVSNGDILLGGYSITTSAVSNTIDNRPAYNNFTNVFFDSSEKGASFEAMVETEFVGCWFSNGRKTDPGNITGVDKSGATIFDCDSLKFTNTRFFNCGFNGCLVETAARRIIFTACSFESNSASAGNGVAHGLVINNNSSYTTVINCIAHNGLYVGGLQGYGIFVGVGSSNIIIKDNLLYGNYSGGMLIGGSVTGAYIGSNIGYKTQSSGSGLVVIGQTVYQATHGLDITPNISNINVGFASAPVNSGVTSLYITAITATTFQIVTNAAVAGNNQAVNWQIL